MSKILDMNSYDDEDNFIPESKAINKAINENNIGLINFLNSELNNQNFITDFTSNYHNLILTENIPHTNLNIFSNNDFSNNNDYHNLNLTPPTNFNNTFTRTCNSSLIHFIFFIS